MRKIEFNIHEQMVKLVLNGYSIIDIANIMNLNIALVIENLREIRRDLIYRFDKRNIRLIGIINNLIGEYQIRQSYSDVLNIVSGNIPDKTIRPHIKTNSYSFNFMLKGIFIHICLYGTKDERRYLGLLKSKISEIDSILKAKDYKYNSQKNIPNDDRPILIGYDIKTALASTAPLREVEDFGQRDYLRFIVIADSHLGSEDENLDYLSEAYEYASKNGISIIIHGGDLLEGSVSNYAKCKDEYKSAEAQVDHVLDDYCYDKNIDNYILLGNHDSSLFLSDYIDLYDKLQYRDDFIPLGYKKAYIKCGNEYIGIKHEVPRVLNYMKDYQTMLSFNGHSHQYLSYNRDDKAFFRIPTLSDNMPSSTQITNKGFLDAEIWFENGNAVNIRVNFVPADHEQKKELEMCLTNKKGY